MNAALLAAILVSNTLRYSELGGAESMFGDLSFVLAVGFLLLNARLHSDLAVIFFFPAFLVWLSGIGNGEGLSLAGINAGLSTTVAYLLLALKPVPLSDTATRRFVALFLFVTFGLSIVMTLRHAGTLLVTGNPNFNVNPNSAARFFLGALILSLAFTSRSRKVLLVIGFSILIVTTGSRAGLICATLALVGYPLMSPAVTDSDVWVFSWKRLRVALGGVLGVAILTVWLIPDAVSRASRRLVADGGRRGAIWEAASTASLRSAETMLIGSGPARAEHIVGRGLHSSYWNSIISFGWPFMAAVVAAIGYLCLYHIRRGHLEFVLYAGVICIYGAAESTLFVGLGSIWFILIFLSLYFRSCEHEGEARILVKAQP